MNPLGQRVVGWESWRNETQVGVDLESLGLLVGAAKKAGLEQRVEGLRVEKRSWC